jgi:pilus assembly protein Flp/PilA
MMPTSRLKHIADSDEGASAVEYGLLVAAIAAIIILVVFALGGFVKGAFKTTCDGFAGSGQVSSTITTGTATCAG